MIKQIVTKVYGRGYDVQYDPRFPGFFSATFLIKGIEKTIHNIRRSDVTFINESCTAKDKKTGQEFSINKWTLRSGISLYEFDWIVIEEAEFNNKYICEGDFKFSYK